MARLRFTREAEHEFREISAFIADASGSRVVADAFAERLYARCRKLASLPGTMGRERSEVGPGIRSSVFGSYVIFFRYFGNVFEVVSILEGHRDIQTIIQALGERRPED